MSSTKVEAVTSKSYLTELEKFDRHQMYKEVFHIFDKDCDNSISSSEVKSLVISLGYTPNEEELQKFIEEVDTDKSGRITLNEFIEYMDRTYVVSNDITQEVVEAFKIFDIDNNGCITYDEFKNILTKYGDKFDEQDVKDIFRLTDYDKNGKVSYAEFVELWKYQ